MFRSNLIHRAAGDRNLRNRIYCILCTMLLVAANVRAEDDVYEVDPNFTIFEVFRDLWDFLTGLVG